MSNFKIAYTHEDVATAICIWEWMLDHNGRLSKPGAIKPGVDVILTDLFNSYGTSEMRDLAIRAVPIVEACWQALAEEHPLRDSFDWEFVPALCRVIDWTELYNKEFDTQGVELLTALVNATEALGV